MLKRLIIILAITNINFAFAANIAPTKSNYNKIYINSNMENIKDPGKIAFNIVTNMFLSLETLKKQNQFSLNNIRALIKSKLIPYADIDFSTEMMLGDFWKELSDNQKIMFQSYVSDSIIRDYAGIFNISYTTIDNITISIKSKEQYDTNKANIKLYISINNDNSNLGLSLKMIKTDRWRIYDAVLAQTSLLEIYKTQFFLHVKNHGMDNLLTTISKN